MRSRSAGAKALLSVDTEWRSAISKGSIALCKGDGGAGLQARFGQINVFRRGRDEDPRTKAVQVDEPVADALWIARATANIFLQRRSCCGRRQAPCPPARSDFHCCVIMMEHLLPAFSPAS